jgi:hypothetical protein
MARWQFHLGLALLMAWGAGLETAAAQEGRHRLFRKESPQPTPTPAPVSEPIVLPAPQELHPPAPPNIYAYYSLTSPYSLASPHGLSNPFAPAASNGGYGPNGQYGPGYDSREPTRVRALMNEHGLGCYSDYNEIQSGSFHSTMAFIFGSSRSFFRETCQPTPPLFSGSLWRGRANGNGCR